MYGFRQYTASESTNIGSAVDAIWIELLLSCATTLKAAF